MSGTLSRAKAPSGSTHPRQLHKKMLSSFVSAHAPSLRQRRGGPLLCACLLATVSGFAGAQEPSAEEKAAARELALNGIRLAEEGKCDEAIDPLTRAEQLFHAPTILTWIGECQIQLGRLVEGSETLREVVREELPDKPPPAFVEAQKRAARLLEDTAPKIAKLTIYVEQESGELLNTTSMEVSVDGHPISHALIGAARPTDPGEHKVTVKIPGYEVKDSYLVLLDGSEETLTVKVRRPSSKSQTAAETNQTSEPTDSRKGEGSGQADHRVLGWSLVGGGAAFLAGGGVFGYLALNKKNNLDCPSPSSCPSTEDDKLKTARLFATLSTVSFAVGGAAALTGIILLAVSGDKSTAETALTYHARNGFAVRPEVATAGWASVGLSGQF